MVSAFASDEMQIKRIMIRDEINREEAERRLDSQLPKSFFRENSDYIVCTNSSINETTKKVETIVGLIINKLDEFEL